MMMKRIDRTTLPIAFTAAIGVCIAVGDITKARDEPRRPGPGTLGTYVTAETVDGEVIDGALQLLSLPDGVVVREVGGAKRHVPARDLVRISTTVRPWGRTRNDVTLRMVDGDTLSGRIVQGDDESVVLDTQGLGRVHVPLDVLERLDTARAFQLAYRESVAWLDRSRRNDTDRILLTNGDVVEGFLTAIGVEGVSIEGSFGETLVPHHVVVAVRLAPGVAVAVHEPHFRVHLRNSGRVTVTGFDWKDDIARARLRHGGDVTIDAGRIVRIEVLGGRWEWLSNHRPISFEHTPMLSLDWDYSRDRNVLGRPIRVAGEMFEHGVGVHSRSSLIYDLKGAYREFVTRFGIDDDSGALADVSVLILVDGMRRFDQVNVRPGELHGPVRLDVTRANRIELIVDFGDNGDVQDRFNWVEPALIR